MKRMLIACAVLPLLLAVHQPPLIGSEWDLAVDWSDTENPNGPWSYIAGTTLLPTNFPNWAGTNNPAWANAVSGYGHIPSFLRVVPGSVPFGDAPPGSVICHGDDPANWTGVDPANVTWTSPVDELLLVQGGVWHTDLHDRASSWSISFNGQVRASGTLSYGDQYGSDTPAPFYFIVDAHEGDVLKLEFVRTDYYGTFSGAILNISSTTPTIGVVLTCSPSAGTLPFTSVMSAELSNLYEHQVRTMAARMDVSLANGAWYSNWRTGYTNISAGGNYASSWSQQLPGLAALVGDNVFTLVAEDVTPAPYNQPPYPPAGVTATAACTVTGLAP